MPIDPAKLTAYRQKRRELRDADQAVEDARQVHIALKGELDMLGAEIEAGMAEGEAYVDGQRVYVKIDGNIRRFTVP